MLTNPYVWAGAVVLIFAAVTAALTVHHRREVRHRLDDLTALVDSLDLSSDQRMSEIQKLDAMFAAPAFERGWKDFA